MKKYGFKVAAFAGVALLSPLIPNGASAQGWRDYDAARSGVLDQPVIKGDWVWEDYRGAFHPFTTDHFNAYVNGPIGDEHYVPELHGAYRLTNLSDPTARATLRIRDWYDDNITFLDRITRTGGSRPSNARRTAQLRGALPEQFELRKPISRTHGDSARLYR